MNLRDLEYITAIASLKNMARAAEQCHVSQSTLSIQLKKIEGELGVQIFERTNKRVMLSKEGEEVLRYAQMITRLASELKSLAKHMREPALMPLKIGAFPTLAPYWFPAVVRRLRAAFPKTPIELVEEKTDVLIAQLQAGVLDCAALAVPAEMAEGAHHVVLKEYFVLAVPSSHPLATRRFVRAADLEGESLLLLEEGHCLRGQALEFCVRLKVKEAQNYRATSLETLRNMVRAGSGITVIPECAAQRKEPGLVYLPFVHPKPGRTVALYWRKTHPRADWLREVAHSCES